MNPLLTTIGVVAALTLVGLILLFSGQPVYWPGYGATVLFYGLIFYVGARAGQKERGSSSESLMLAGRNLPLWMSVFTMSATWVGGGYINGTAESTASSGLAWVQAPWGYAASLFLGGLFFARKMRRHRFTTMLDPLAIRFGTRHAAVLYLCALSGELFWTAAILTALGTTFGTILGVDFQTAILLSAAVAIGYTMLGGLWAVAATDVLQLGILLVGLWLVIPYAASSVGGLSLAWESYAQQKGALASPFPPWGGWSDPAWGNSYWQWWDYALLLVFGGIPWHVYFQRVLSSRDEKTAVGLSLTAGVVCIFAAVPAVLIGIIGSTADWQAVGAQAPESAALTLPYVLRYLTPPFIAAIGLGALAAAVMSSVDSSILSASSMAAWNVYRPLMNPEADSDALARVIKRSVLIVGILATMVALKIQSVYALWFLCSDLVYCILFPQLLTALFDPKANRWGARAGLLVSLILRFGGGEPTLGLPLLLPYPMVESGVVLFPFRTLAMVCGLLTILVVSRLTNKVDPPTPLTQPK